MTELYMPGSIEEERIVLGAVLLDPGLWPEVACVAKDAFSSLAMRELYGSMERATEKGLPIDVVTVASLLRDAGHLEDLNGVGGIAGLTDTIPQLQNVGQYLRIIQQKARVRAAQRHASELLLALSLDTADDGVIQRSVQELTQVLDNHDSDPGPQGATGIVYEYLERLQTKVDGFNEPGIATGWSRTDRLLGGGLHRQQAVVVGGLPGMGKTAVAAQLAIAAWRGGARVGVFELEMENDSLLDRIAAQFTKVNTRRIKEGRNLSRMEFKNIIESLQELTDSLMLDDSRGLSLQDIIARIRRMKRRDGLDVVIIDHLQLVYIAAYKKERRFEVGEIVKILRDLSKELDFALVILSQLARIKEARRPRLSDLRESGDIEAHADVVLFPYRPGYSDDPSFAPQETELAELIIGKQRNGPTGAVDFTFIPGLVMYRENVR